MKKFPLIVFAIVVTMATGGHAQLIAPLQPGQYKMQSWYPKLLAHLSKHNRIDSSEAHMRKNLSSSIGVHQTPLSALIEEEGKLDSTNVYQVYRLDSDKPVLQVFMRSGHFCHLFEYDVKADRLEQVPNLNIMVVVDSRLRLCSLGTGSAMFCTPGYSREDWAGYFLFDRKARTLRHVRNCRVFNGRNECNEIQLHP
jgi:hypothetical protein